MFLFTAIRSANCWCTFDSETAYIAHKCYLSRDRVLLLRYFFQVEFGSILRDAFSKLLVLIPQHIIQRDRELAIATQSRN